MMSAVVLVLYATDVISFGEEEDPDSSPSDPSDPSDPVDSELPESSSLTESGIVISPDAQVCTQYFSINSAQTCKENNAGGVGWFWDTTIPGDTNFPGEDCKNKVNHYLVDFETPAFPGMSFRKKALGSDSSVGIRAFGEYAFKGRTIRFSVLPMNEEGESLSTTAAVHETVVEGDCQNAGVSPDEGEKVYYEWNENGNIMNIKLDMTGSSNYSGWAKPTWWDGSKHQVLYEEPMSVSGSSWTQVPTSTTASDGTVMGGGIRLDCHRNNKGDIQTKGFSEIVSDCAGVKLRDNVDEDTIYQYTPRWQNTCVNGRAVFKNLSCPKEL